MRNQRTAAAPEAYFGADGYSCAGAYAPWSEFECHLASASVDTIPPRRISFTFHKAVSQGKTSWRRFYQVQTVPIPPGAEADLATLQSQLESRCPKAQVALVQP